MEEITNIVTIPIEEYRSLIEIKTLYQESKRIIDLQEKIIISMHDNGKVQK